VGSFSSIGSFFKEELHIQGTWTDGGTDRVIPQNCICGGIIIIVLIIINLCSEGKLYIPV